MILYLLANSCSLICLFLQLLIVFTHPEPADKEPWKKSYRSLITTRSIIGLALSSVGITSTYCYFSQIRHIDYPLLSVLNVSIWASAGLVLVWVDAMTTWLPIGCNYFLAALLICLSFAYWIYNPDIYKHLRWALNGSLGMGILFFLIWWISHSFGFGDVRLAVLTGWVGGMLLAHSIVFVMLASTSAAAIYGLATQWYRRSHPHPLGNSFPYGPGLWSGPLLVLSLPLHL